MRYFVTGGTGFIGAYTVRRLVDAGHEVTVFDLAPNRRFLEEIVGDAAGTTVLSGDVADAFAVLHAVRESGADAIIHLAATLSSLSDANPIRALRVNCEGTLNVFEAALASGVERVVWGSSIGVFGTPGTGAMAGTDAEDDDDVVIPNDACHRPTGVYGACKSFNERLAGHYRAQRGLDSLGLRFALVYGYGKSLTVQRGTRAPFMVELIDKPALGQPGHVPNGDAILDWVYVEDVARAIELAAMTKGQPSIAVNVCGERHPVRHVATVIRELIPEAQLTVDSGDWSYNVRLDATAARNQIGYEPTISLEAGLAKTIEATRSAARAA